MLQMLEILRIGLLFPIYSVAYIMAPHSELGRTLRKPFIKFICHSASYISFLCKQQDREMLFIADDQRKKETDPLNFRFPSFAHTSLSADRNCNGGMVRNGRDEERNEKRYYYEKRRSAFDC